MKQYSFIDFELKDFLRYPEGSVIIIDFDSQEEAEEWLLDNGDDYGWTNMVYVIGVGMNKNNYHLTTLNKCGSFNKEI